MTARLSIKGSSVVLAALLLLTLAPVAPASAATASRSAEIQFVDMINATRARRGLDRVRPMHELTSVARRHSARMASRNDLYHNPNLGDEVSNWTRLTENVGRGASVRSLHDAFMSSSGHRANILDRRVTQLGIGVKIRSGRIWVTEVFRKPQRAASLSFRDVSGGTGHAKAIRRLAAQSITLGCSARRFCPDQSVTRDEMATFLNRSMARFPRGGNSFSDVASSSIHRPSINSIAAANVTQGCSSKRYCPGGKVTRAEMATFLTRALNLKQRSGSSFADVQAGSTHAGAIEAIARAGITNGCRGGRHFCPHASVTRAQMASFLVRAFDL